MCAGRESNCADSIGINPVLVSMRPQVTNSALDVFDLRGESVLGTKPILNRGGNESLFGERPDFAGVHTLVALSPGTTVDDNDTGRGSRQSLWAGKIQMEVNFSTSAINDI
jgi:hypothetical protein